MKRLSPTKPMGRLGSKLSARDAIPLKAKRVPLTFVPEQPNPLAKLKGAKPTKTKAEGMKRELDAVGKAFREAAKNTSKLALHELSGYGAEAFLVVFEDSDQATAFLRAMKYPHPKDVFVDGTILADILSVKLPAAKAAVKKLKSVQNPKLTRLAQPLR